MNKINYYIFANFFSIFSNQIISDIQDAIKQECGYGDSFIAGNRTEYNKNQNKPKSCPFCAQIAENQDQKYFILKRSKYSYVCLNYYPYMDGHLMVIPQRHTGEIEDLPVEEYQDLMSLVKESVINLKKWRATGANIGANIGKTAGASIPGHLHIHILPRYDYYLNFVFTTSNMVIVSMTLENVFKELSLYFY